MCERALAKKDLKDSATTTIQLEYRAASLRTLVCFCVCRIFLHFLPLCFFYVDCQWSSNDFISPSAHRHRRYNIFKNSSRWIGCLSVSIATSWQCRLERHLSETMRREKNVKRSGVRVEKLIAWNKTIIVKRRGDSKWEFVHSARKKNVSTWLSV